VSHSDPLMRFRVQLIHSGKFTEDELNALDAEAKKTISAAHKKVIKAADPSPDSIFNFVLPEPYKAEKYPEGLHDGTKGKPMKLIQALNETLKDEFRKNPDTYIWGQDVANKDKGGIFNVTKGMQQEFGKERVFNAPIAEDYILGTANGMSRFNDKIRIVVEGAEFADYFWPAMEQLVEASHDYWRSNGAFAPNVTIRLASGGYIGGGLYHSQTIEGALATLPGLRIVYPSYADDAAGLLRTAMRSKGPTVFLEPKALYNDPVAETVVPDDFEVPFGKARIRRSGSDLSIITYGNTTHMAVQVADRISDETGKEIEVLDIRSLIPLDKEAIVATVKKTSRVLVVHEEKVFAGFGSELASFVAEEAFVFLDAPVKRVGSTFTPVGFNPILEKAILPNADKIYAAAMEILKF
jgi:2-oxoisovalerate dehydrogenase E1 component